MKTRLLKQTVVLLPRRSTSARTSTACSMIKINSNTNNPQLEKTPQNKGLVIQDCPHYRYQVPKGSLGYTHFLASANLRFLRSFFKFNVLLEWLWAFRKNGTLNSYWFIGKDRNQESQTKGHRGQSIRREEWIRAPTPSLALPPSMCSPT